FQCPHLRSTFGTRESPLVKFPNLLNGNIVFSRFHRILYQIDEYDFRSKMEPSISSPGGPYEHPHRHARYYRGRSSAQLSPDPFLAERGGIRAWSHRPGLGARSAQGGVIIPKLERSQWYDLSRDMNWQFKYVSEAEVFPEALSHSHGIPAAAWWSWEEPYKISYREYVHNQAEKDAGVYSVRSAIARSRLFDNLDPGWKAAIV